MKRDRPKNDQRDTAVARLEAALADGSTALSPSGRQVAAYVRDNLALIPFETGASIAVKLGVSEMTVLRAIGALGYANLRDFKAALRATRSGGAGRPFEDVHGLFRARQESLGDLSESLKLQLDAVVEAYELATTERWREAVDLLASRRNVFVVGFLATKGVAWDLTNRLMTARAGVHFVEGSEGVYNDILEADPAESCLVFVDTVARTRYGTTLARWSRDRGLPVVMLTNRFSNWGYEFTDLVFEGHTSVNTFWDSTASLSVIANLLINSTAVRLGRKAQEHQAQMKDLGRIFGAFEWVRRPPVRRPRKAR